MTRRIIRRQRAHEDLAGHFAYLGRRSLTVAERFLAEVDAAMRRLAENPFLGGVYPSDHPRLRQLRCFRVSRRFKKYWFFYFPLKDGIDIVRVLHGSQAVETILQSEF